MAGQPSSAASTLLCSPARGGSAMATMSPWCLAARCRSSLGSTSSACHVTRTQGHTQGARVGDSRGSSQFACMRGHACEPGMHACILSPPAHPQGAPILATLLPPTHQEQAAAQGSVRASGMGSQGQSQRPQPPQQGMQPADWQAAAWAFRARSRSDRALAGDRNSSVAPCPSVRMPCCCRAGGWAAVCRWGVQHAQQSITPPASGRLARTAVRQRAANSEHCVPDTEYDQPTTRKPGVGQA